MTSSPLLAYDDAAAYLHVSRAKLERLVADRAVAHVKVGKRVFFTHADLDAFIEASRVEAVASAFADITKIEAAARPSPRRAGRAGGPNLSVIGRAR